MDSLEQSNLRRGFMPFIAIFQADIESLFRNRITYAWLIAGVFLNVLMVLNPGQATSAIIPSGLSVYLQIWSLIIIGTTASTVSSEAGELADSIMSKSVKRQDYIFAKFASRIVYTTTVYLAITAVLVVTSLRLTENDFEIYGLIAAILVVLVAIIMLTSLGVTFSTFVSNSVISIVSLLILWFSMNNFFPLLDLELLSPTTLISDMPDLIQGIWSSDILITTGIFSYIAIVTPLLTALYFTIKDL